MLVDHIDGEIRQSTFETLTAARGFGEPAAVAVGPVGTAARLAEGLRSRGMSRMYLSETASRDLVTAHVELLAALAGSGNPVALLVGTAADGPEIAARLHRRTGRALVTDVAAVSGRGNGARTATLGCAAGYPLPGELAGL